MSTSSEFPQASDPALLEEAAREMSKLAEQASPGLAAVFQHAQETFSEAATKLEVV